MVSPVQEFVGGGAVVRKLPAVRAVADLPVHRGVRAMVEGATPKLPRRERVRSSSAEVIARVGGELMTRCVASVTEEISRARLRLNALLVSVESRMMRWSPAATPSVRREPEEKLTVLLLPVVNVHVRAPPEARVSNVSSSRT